MILAQQEAELPSLTNELKTRAKIGLLMLLAMQMSLVVNSSINNISVLMVLASLMEIVTIVIISRFAGQSNVARDFNEFSFYALILHLIEIPVFYYTDLSSDFHNNGAWILFGLGGLRLFYFGPKTAGGDYQGLPTFGLLAHVQNELAKTQKIAFKYWSEILFFGAAIPLWFIVWRTNDQEVSLTIIVLMLFIYFMSDTFKRGALAARTPDIAANNAKPTALVQADVDEDEVIYEWRLPAPITPAEHQRVASIDALIAANIPTAAEIETERLSLTYEQAEIEARAEQARLIEKAAERRSQRNLKANRDAADINNLIARLYDNEEERVKLLNYETIVLCAIFNARSPSAQSIIFNIVATDFNVGEQDDFLQSAKAVAQARNFVKMLRASNDVMSLSDRAVAVAASYQGAKTDVKKDIELTLETSHFSDHLSARLMPLPTRTSTEEHSYLPQHPLIDIKTRFFTRIAPEINGEANTYSLAMRKNEAFAILRELMAFVSDMTEQDRLNLYSAILIHGKIGFAFDAYVDDKRFETYDEVVGSIVNFKLPDDLFQACDFLITAWCRIAIEEHEEVEDSDVIEKLQKMTISFIEKYSSAAL